MVDLKKIEAHFPPAPPEKTSAPSISPPPPLSILTFVQPPPFNF